MEDNNKRIGKSNERQKPPWWVQIISMAVGFAIGWFVIGLIM